MVRASFCSFYLYKRLNEQNVTLFSKIFSIW